MTKQIAIAAGAVAGLIVIFLFFGYQIAVSHAYL